MNEVAKKDRSSACNDARRDIEMFIRDNDGGVSADAVRDDYKRYVKPHENNPELADLVKRAREAMAYAIKRAFVPTPCGKYKGLYFEGGGIQMPEGEPIDIEVYAGSKSIGFYDYKHNPGRTPEEKIAIKEYMKKIGVGSKYIHNSITSTRTIVQNALERKACNAKFKVGDWVVYKDGYHGRWKVIQTKVQGISDKIRLQNYDGKTEDTYEECVKVDNSLSTNSVVANAMAARVAKNALDVNQQRTVQAALPSIKKDYESMKSKGKKLASNTAKVFDEYSKVKADLQKCQQANKEFIAECDRIARKYPDWYYEDSTAGGFLSELRWNSTYFIDNELKRYASLNFPSIF